MIPRDRTGAKILNQSLWFRGLYYQFAVFNVTFNYLISYDLSIIRQCKIELTHNSLATLVDQFGLDR